MIINPDASTQAEEAIFSRKIKKKTLILLWFSTMLLCLKLTDRLESTQYNACLAVTGAIRGTSREKLYQELGLEPLRLRRWYRKHCLFYKVFKNEHPQYLFHLITLRH